MLALSVAALSSAASYIPAVRPCATRCAAPRAVSTFAAGSTEDEWKWWFTVPFLAPYGERRTELREIVKGQVWTLDQLQGTFQVHVPTRATVVKLPSTGGLLVYAPVAPTPRCIKLVRELEAAHGPVQHIILPTVCVEHKFVCGPFARNFPTAQCWVAPDQYALPVNLPLPFLGFPIGTKTLPPTEHGTPWAADCAHTLLGPLDSKQGKFEEVAFLHRPSRTLMVVDSVVAISPTPPSLLEEAPAPLLFHSRDDMTQPVIDTAAARLKGWMRIVLFALYFRPGGLKIVEGADNVFGGALQSPERTNKELGWFGIYPFEWQPGWERSFEALQGGLFVAPGLQTIIFNRFPEQVLDWVETVAAWDFERVIPAHLDGPVKADGKVWREAFRFLEETGALGNLGMVGPRLLSEDMSLINEAEVGLVKDGTILPRAPLAKRR